MSQIITDPPAAMEKKRAPWNETIRTMLIAVAIAVVFRSFAYEPFHIPSGSMKSNLLVGDYLFVSKFTYGYSRYSFPLGLPLFKGRAMELTKPQRGDVVVFRLPANPRVDYIKRVMGLPGDRIQVKDGVVYINGAALPREAVDTWVDDELPDHAKSIPRLHEVLPEGKTITILKEKSGGFANNTPEYVVPQGKFFMMGDNRDNSRDSRFQDDIGFIPEENIVGRAQFIFFSVGGETRLWEIWRWLPEMRFSRFFHAID